MAPIRSECKGCTTPKPIPKATSYKMADCCSNKPTEPGMCRIFVLKGNVARNRIPGSPGNLPMFAVEHAGNTYHCKSVRTLGPVEFRTGDSTDDHPFVWGETTWPVEMTYA